MSQPAILWVDGDALHATAARRLLQERHPDWQVVNSPSPDTARAPLASHAWDAVVLCLQPTEHDLPGVLAL